MKRQRRPYSADWKAKVAFEAIPGQRTVQEIASPDEVHPTLVTHGKKQWREGAAEIFSKGQRGAADADEELQAELYQALGYPTPAAIYSGKRQAAPGDEKGGCYRSTD